MLAVKITFGRHSFETIRTADHTLEFGVGERAHTADKQFNALGGIIG